MEVKFDVTPETAALIEELRGEGQLDIDGMVSKLIPYGLLKDTEVDGADLYFEDAWFDFGLEEIEEEVGRSLTDAEVREVMIAKIATYLNSEFEIDAAYMSEVSEGASVHITCDMKPVTIRRLVADACREIEEIPLVEVYDAYADRRGEIYEEIPEENADEDEEGTFREIVMADVFFCPGAEPEDLSGILRLRDIPEAHSYDYIVPQEVLEEEAEEADGDSEAEDEEDDE